MIEKTTKKECMCVQLTHIALKKKLEREGKSTILKKKLKKKKKKKPAGHSGVLESFRNIRMFKKH